MVGRVKRIKVPDELRSRALAPRHLSPLAYLLFGGPMSVSDIADRIGVAPLAPAERKLFIDTLTAYEDGLTGY
ncbi:hypothetical protein AB0N81_09870 [Streptomyces sp. NPDC093510]|uniref:hypothetical protein n=1 Tax=Streptomyces sp. NPDC093510 TaxID=3155199 RepID=UPI003444D77F